MTNRGRFEIKKNRLYGILYPDQYLLHLKQPQSDFFAHPRLFKVSNMLDPSVYKGAPH